MPPLQDGSSIREKRLQEGCCPNCGTRLYKVAHGSGGLHMPKMFRKRGDNNNSGGVSNHHGGSPNPRKMTPLTIPGVAERGQCLKCLVGYPGRSECGALDGCNGGNALIPRDTLPTVKAVPAFPSVKAVPVMVTLAPHERAPRQIRGGGRKSPPQSSPQAAAATSVSQAKNQQTAGGISTNGDVQEGAELKQPPELLIAGSGQVDLQPPPTRAFSNLSSIPAYPGNRSSSEESSSGDDSSSSDEGSLEGDELERRFDLCRLESDHASSSLVNNLRQNSAVRQGGALELEHLLKSEEDDRKPAAKPAGASVRGRKSISQQMEESTERIRKLQLEAAAVDLAYLEASTTKKPPEELECPSGMSPEVFYQLPAEMQKEVMEERNKDNGQKNNKNNVNGRKIRSGGEGDAAVPAAADIDPETLASLPDSIRKEVLEQARREQQRGQQQQGRHEPKNDASVEFDAAALLSFRHSQERQEEGRQDPDKRRAEELSKSTTEFLKGFDMNADDFAAFPEEVKADILQEKRRSSKVGAPSSSSSQWETPSSSAARPSPPASPSALATSNEEQELAARSGYDPETLASLPEDVRREVLNEERREREETLRKEREQRAKKDRSVGAHSVNVPAGYDPDTFSALPKDVQRELLEDAAQQRSYAAEGYDHDAVAEARIVAARPAGDGGGGGATTSCTYIGDYNVAGKRHGDGELKWANGDRYVGKFKDGYIEGRGTISFHDGAFP